jgi:hypothetical protein
VDSTFLDLSEREHVLHNLVSSYNLRDITEYGRILDLDYFQFFFSDDDVGGGLPPMGWDRTQDMLATANLLNRSSSSPNRIISIVVDVDYSDLIWTEVAADPPLVETWYTAVTTYQFAFDTANGNTYATHGDAHAQFTVRNIGTPGSPQYRLVRWKDLGHVTLVRVIHPSEKWQ